MKVLVFVKATPNSEQGMKPSPELVKLFAEMGRFNEELVEAGIMKEGDGLKPSSFGKRVKFSDGKVTVIDGPFAETKELVAGYWVWEVKSMDEALEWAKRCPNPMPGEEGVLELRPVYALEDFADLLPPSEVAKEQQLEQRLTRTKPGRNQPKARARKKGNTNARAKSKAAATGARRKPSRARSGK
jgi:hypothetical protein